MSLGLNVLTPPSDAFMCRWTRSPLVQVLAFRRQAITWTNAGLLSVELLGTTLSEIRIGILIFSLKPIFIWNCRLPNWRPFCQGGDELNLELTNILHTSSPCTLHGVYFNMTEKISAIKGLYYIYLTNVRVLCWLKKYIEIPRSLPITRLIWTLLSAVPRKAVKFNHSLSKFSSEFKHFYSWKWRPFCLGLNVLTHWGLVTPYGDRDLGQHWLR